MFGEKLERRYELLVRVFLTLGCIVGVFLIITGILGGNCSKNTVIVTVVCFLCTFYYAKRNASKRLPQNSKEINAENDEGEYDDDDEDDE